MRKILRLVILSIMLALPVVGAVAADQQVLFSTEHAAQKTCPSDVVVWVNTQTMVYHYRGMRWYEATKNGAYMCERSRDKVGARPTRNGQ